MNHTLRTNLLSLPLALLIALLARPAGAAFEDVEVSPRARALGSAWVALGADHYAPYHNPAVLAWADRPTGVASHLRPFGVSFASQSAVAGTGQLPRGLGGLGLGLRRFAVDFRGEHLTEELTLTLAHGVRLRADRQSELAVGWALNVFDLDYGPSVSGVDPGRASTVGLDIGAAASIRERTRIGFHVQNLNSPEIGRRDHEPLRRRVSVGLSYQPYPGVESVLSAMNELGEPIQFRGGAEFQIAEFAWLRAGLLSDPSTLTAGFGVRFAGMGFDYGFSGGGVLGASHHIGIGLTLPRSE